MRSRLCRGVIFAEMCQERGTPGGSRQRLLVDIPVSTLMEHLQEVDPDGAWTLVNVSLSHADGPHSCIGGQRVRS